MNVLDNPKSKTMILDDGKEYILSPANLYILGELEEVFDCNMSEIIEKLNSKTAQTLNKCLYVLLKDNHSELDIKKTGQLIKTATKLNESVDMVIVILNEFAG